MRPFRLPDLGEGLREAEIVQWHVTPGQDVDAGQPLLTVETDKAQVEVTAPWAGRVAALHAEPGDLVETGALLVEFEGAEIADAGTLVGRLPTAPLPPASAEPVTGAAPRVAPAARVRARELGVDLAHVIGSGPGGTIGRADVERAAGAEPAAPLDTFRPLRGVRAAMARNMARAGREVVAATVVDDADLHGWPEGRDVLPRLVRALVAACGIEPALNAWYGSGEPSRRLHTRVDLALAVQTRDGLFAPVLRDAANFDLTGIRRQIDALETAARDRRLRPEDLRGATLTLSNFGSLGGRYAALSIVPPQVAILGAGRARERVVALDGEPRVRRMLPLSLTFDHRAVTGAEAVRFLVAVIADLERSD